ncbi:ATP synthase protein I [Pseudochelatococcus lubricantis]|uniref:ATP synthase protein I n=1 Tax=Pseudochelatococcus lubricantis TaxID=1538102 RepID=A0ABX0V2J0_9HYPH|nr:AtpZ/AtpI family protein [Pseudochelatococcus lubricantis]NIJ57276.1 ATP synthase protein I [Pseudochelatococcus lubricantis]
MSGNGEDGRQPEDRDLAKRLDDLGRRLSAKEREALAARKAQEPRPGGDATAMSNALRLSGEFIAGVVAGAGIGWAIDTYLGLSPWGLIVFLLLGFLTGVWNVLRAAGYLKTPRDHGSGGR